MRSLRAEIWASVPQQSIERVLEGVVLGEVVWSQSVSFSSINRLVVDLALHLPNVHGVYSCFLAQLSRPGVLPGSGLPAVVTALSHSSGTGGNATPLEHSLE